jgi:hypothetical protein
MYGWEGAEQISIDGGFSFPPEDSYNRAERGAFHRRIRKMATACRHPKVRIVSRHEDTEFVECLECGEVFDSEEFRDMEIEETADTEDAPDGI